MASITIRNLDDETHRALRVRAAQNGRSTEAEIRAILDAAAKPAKQIQIGSVLAAFGDKYDLNDLRTERDQDFHRAANFD